MLSGLVGPGELGLVWRTRPGAVILEPKKIKSVTVSIVSPSICHEVMGKIQEPLEQDGERIASAFPNGLFSLVNLIQSPSTKFSLLWETASTCEPQFPLKFQTHYLSRL